MASTITLSGNATDDRAVATVDVAIRNTATTLWLRLDGTWGAFQWLPASVTSPGATSTGWTYPWAPPGTGSFAIQARAIDGAIREKQAKGVLLNIDRKGKRTFAVLKASP